MRTTLLAAALLALAPFRATAADAPPVAGAAPSPPLVARTVKPALHDHGHRTRHCTATHIRVREGTRWVKRTRRTCSY
ncbi:MAG TPA: hypothetical protein VHD15_13135 [Hyphomicrobiales bacterium]|nr:hypothetical protein [Hyphomicrobiales bacterium]